MLENLNSNSQKLSNHWLKIRQKVPPKWIFLIVCFALTFLLYGLTISGDFVFDDRGIVDHKDLLSNLNLLDRVVTLPYWTEAAGLYRPVTLFSYTLNFLFLGSGPAGFHFINLILYALTGFLLYLLVDKLFSRKILAYLSGIIFLILPIHTEAVANIIGRAEILALFFSLLGFLAVLKDRAPANGIWRRVKDYWPAGLWFFLAIGSKETAIAAWPIAALIIYFKEKDFWRREVLSKYWPAGLWLILSLAAYFGLRLMVLGRQYFLGVETSIVENPLKFAAFWPRILTALKVLWLYILKSFWPLNLCSDYSYNQIPVLNNFFNWQTVAGAAILLFFIISVFLFFHRARFLTLASAFFLFSYLPIANLIFPTGTIMGERLMYYPSVGLSFYLAFFFYKLLKIRSRAAKYSSVVFLVLLAAFYGTVTFLRAGDWLTEKRLFTTAAKCSPNSVLSRSNLGAQYYLEGDLAKAKSELLLSKSIYDGYPKGINNLGLVYWKEGDHETARQLFLRALDFRFPYYGAYENLALISLEEGKVDEARNWLLKFYSDNKIAAENYLQNYLTAAQLQNDR